jgi:prolyl-tRNA synthetase
VEVESDARDMRGGDKAWSWIKKGAPLRVEIGPRDMASDSVFVARRDRSPKEKAGVPRAQFVAEIAHTLDEIQAGLRERARAFRDQHLRRIEARDEFTRFFTPPAGKSDGEAAPIHGGFALAHFCGDPAVEAQVKDELGVTVRCIPSDPELAGDAGACVITGKPSPQRVVWAKAY